MRAGNGRSGVKVTAFVEGQGYIAVLAVEGMAATRTEDKAAVAAAIQEKYGLLTFSEDLLQSLLERGADEVDTVGAILGRHINQQHLRHGQVHDALRELDKLIVLSRVTICQGLQ